MKIKRIGKISSAIGIFLFITVGLTWIIQGEDFALTKFWAPKYEAVRRQTFEESKAYNQGMIQELQNMRFQYIQANKDQKQALASIILHRSADYEEAKMPNDLKLFVQQLKHEYGEIH